MTPDELCEAFKAAGLDAPEKVQAALTDLATQRELKLIDIQLDSLGQKQAELVKPVQDERTELTSRRAFLTAQLSGA